MVSTAIDPNAVARVLGIKTEFRDFREGGVLFLPQRIAVFGQGATAATFSTDKRQVFSAGEAGAVYGFGSPIHLAVRELLPANGDGVGTLPVTVYPVAAAGGAVAAAGDITPAGAVTKAGAFRIVINDIASAEFVVAIGDTDADIVDKMLVALNANINMPMTGTDNATDLGLTAKWAGASGNDLTVAVTGPDDTGVTFGITQPAGGLVNPGATELNAALNQVGNVWETIAVNCFDPNDTTILDTFDTFGEGRWGVLVHKPLGFFRGNGEADVATSNAVPDARPTDRSNVQISTPGSNALPCVIAARAVARIAPRAASNPPFDYGSLPLDTLVPGADGSQWDYLKKDTAVKAGNSTTDVVDNEVRLSDVVTHYKPIGEEPPAYRFWVDIVRLQNIIFNIALEFEGAEWDGAPLIPDGQPTVNPAAKTPSMAKADAGLIIDSLGLNAILSDPATAKKNTQAEIDSGNPKRLNLCVPVQLSGNTNVKSTDLKFGFFFGTPAALA